MEYNNSSESSPKVGWGILDSYGGCNNKQQTHGFVNPRQAGGGAGDVLYCNDSNLGISSKASVVSESFHCPIKDTVAGFGSYMINLRLGSQPAGEGLPPTNCSEATPPSISIPQAKNNSNGSSTPSKRSRASYQNMQNPCCQVEGCNLSLKAAKDYHRRHRICEAHSKNPKVVVGGLVRRFCQQCSRFHDLSEFDDKKRSCRKRLSDHNARRRRLPPESLHHLSSSSAALPSALYDQRSHNIALNSDWQENASTAYTLRQTRESSTLGVIGPLKIGPGLDEPACFLSGEIPISVSNPHMGSGDRFCPFQTSGNIRAADQSMHAAARTDPHGVPSVLSLLSSNSWYLNGVASSSVVNDNAPAMNNGCSSGMKLWSDNGSVIAVDQALMHGEEGASSSSSMQENGSCFLFQPKGFF